MRCLERWATGKEECHQKLIMPICSYAHVDAWLTVGLYGAGSCLLPLHVLRGSDCGCQVHLWPTAIGRDVHPLPTFYWYSKVLKQVHHTCLVCAYNRAPHVGREVDRGADRDAPPPRREELPPRPRERERERERPANGHRESFRERDAAPRYVFVAFLSFTEPSCCLCAFTCMLYNCSC